MPHKARVAKRPWPQESDETLRGECGCGAVVVEIGVPARWAWHDHSRATQRAHGAAYATYLGCYKSRMRVVAGGAPITRYEDASKKTVRGFCARCGTPLFYERGHSPEMVNVSRALFTGRTGREPRYHIGLGESPQWAYRMEPLVPLKGFSGVVWERPGRRKKNLDPFGGE